MNFVDETLLAFADPVSAANVFTERSLKAIVSASYRVSDANLSGVPVPRFDSLEIAPFSGFASTEIQHATYRVSQWSGGAGWQATQIAPGLNTRADLLWRGSIELSAAFERAQLGFDSSAVPDLANVDGDIPPPVPTDPDALETARRVVVLERLRAGAHSGQSVTDELLDRWIGQSGFADVGSFLQSAAASTSPMSQFVLSFASVPGTSVVAPQRFPIAAALMIRDSTDAEFRLVDFLQATRQLQSRLEIEGITPKDPGPSLPSARPVTVWVVPEQWFDQDGWPGGDSGDAQERRLDRITKTTRWLSNQGIGLVPVSN